MRRLGRRAAVVGRPLLVLRAEWGRGEQRGQRWRCTRRLGRRAAVVGGRRRSFNPCFFFGHHHGAAREFLQLGTIGLHGLHRCCSQQGALCQTPFLELLLAIPTPRQYHRLHVDVGIRQFFKMHPLHL